MRGAWILALAFVAACFTERVSYNDGEVRCGARRECPAGFSCGADDRCWRPGQQPDAGSIDASSAACVEGTRTCQQLDVYRCVGGVLKRESTCGKACIGGVCTECKPNTLGCSGSQPLRCSENGNWTSGEPCPAATPQCDEGICVAPCAPSGAFRCSPDGSSVQQCDNSGQFVTLRMCTNVCLTTPAVDCGGVCRPGSKQCGPDQTPQTCTAAGQWKDEPACAGICVRGLCEGECRPFSTRCSGEGKVESCGADARWTGDISSCTFVCNPTTGKCDGECQPKTLRCDGTKATQCDTDGYFKVQADCGAVPCTGGECKPCSEGTTQCNGNMPQRCSGGVWANLQEKPCSYACDAQKGCTGVCSPGSTVCDGAVKKSCGADAQFASEETCTYACVGGECTGVCMPGKRRCNGAVAQTCGSTGQWGSDLSCAYGCDELTGDCKACVADARSVTCPTGACGDRLDNCGTKVTCDPCTVIGETCGGGGVAGVCGCKPDDAAQTCQGRCGPTPNNCGQSVACPDTCVTPQSCNGGTVQGVCGCTGKTRDELCAGKNCGTVTNECGVELSCWPTGTSSCAVAQQTCGGGGTANVCGCTPSCSGKTCGSDGCGGSCGTCGGTQTCDGSGQCVEVCVKLTKSEACAGKNCGDVSDNCGGTYSCWPVGTSTCSGTNKTCGGGGTPNVCGCTPSCTGKVCGPDSCGGTCGAGCPTEKSCSADQTSCVCKSAAELCGTRNCGSYTAGSCTVTCQPNSCALGQTCDANTCRCLTSGEFCSGKACAVDAYVGSCGPYNCGDCSNTPSIYDSCQSDFTCRCVRSYDCSGLECGGVADGCGGIASCGSCGTNSECVDGICYIDPCSNCCGHCCCEVDGCAYCGP